MEKDLLKLLSGDEKLKIQAYLDFLKKKYKNMSILLYGAGLLTDLIFHNFDLEGFNFIGIADINFVQEKGSFENLLTIKPEEILKHKPDIIMISVVDIKTIKRYFNNLNPALNEFEIVHILPESILGKNESENPIGVNYPETISIELTNQCNLRCKMCVAHGGQNNQSSSRSNSDSYMSVDAFKSILDQINFKTIIAPQFRGEPLMHPDFLNILRIINNKKLEFGFTTNGLMFNQRIQEKLLQLEYFKYICFSIDGINKETYEKIRVGGSFDLMMNNIIDFCKKANKEKINITVNYVRQSDNEQEFEEFCDFWIDKVSCITWSYVADNNLIPTQYNWHPNRIPCVLPFNNMIILVNGQVVPCCKDFNYTMKMGNVFDTNLMEIWNGLAFKEFRRIQQTQKWNDFDLCKNCSSWMTSIKSKRDASSAIDIVKELGPYTGKISKQIVMKN